MVFAVIFFSLLAILIGWAIAWFLWLAQPDPFYNNHMPPKPPINDDDDDDPDWEDHIRHDPYHPGGNHW